MRGRLEMREDDLGGEFWIGIAKKQRIQRGLRRHLLGFLLALAAAFADGPAAHFHHGHERAVVLRAFQAGDAVPREPALALLNQVDADVITFEMKSSHCADLEDVGKHITSMKVGIGAIAVWVAARTGTGPVTSICVAMNSLPPCKTGT